MHVQPYIPPSARSKEAWQKIADYLGVHPVVARLAWVDCFAGMELSTWMSMVLNGEMKDLELSNPFTPEELERKQKSYEDAQEERLLSDTLHYRQKMIVEVGDEVVSYEDKTFLSGARYQTQGKRYRITSLEDDGLTRFSATTLCDLKKEGPIYWSHYGIRSIWRDGVEIWNWSLAYYELFVEQNPGHPQTEELRVRSEESARYDRTGETQPCEHTIRRHREGMEDHVYAAGYMSEGENPYEFQRDTSNKLMALIAVRRVTDADISQIALLRKELDDSEWSRWNRGNYARSIKYL